MNETDARDLVAKRLDAMACDLVERGIGPDMILGATLGWAAAHAAKQFGAGVTCDHLARLSRDVTLKFAPPAGVA